VPSNNRAWIELARNLRVRPCILLPRFGLPEQVASVALERLGDLVEGLDGGVLRAVFQAGKGRPADPQLAGELFLCQCIGRPMGAVPNAVMEPSWDRLIGATLSEQRPVSLSLQGLAANTDRQERIQSQTYGLIAILAN
jgi:hypothetical protein